MKKKLLAAFAVIALVSTSYLGSHQAQAATGFVNVSGGTKYLFGDGNYCTNNWIHFKDHWYYFGDDGFLRTGWIQKDNTWYFATSTGELQGGIMKINGNVYYFNTQTCKMFVGQKSYNDHLYTFTENGTVGEMPYLTTEWNSNGTIKRGIQLRIR